MGALPPYPPNLLFALGTLSSSQAAPSASQTLLGGSQWIYVTRRFNNFLSNIALTDDQLDDGRTKISGIVKCLNKGYWDNDANNQNYMLGGSWGKGTQVRPPRDIDVIFFLPAEVYHRFSQRTGNLQSQLLQEVKGILADTYSTTTMRGDGQVVVVGFNSFKVEVVPAFQLDNGQVWICDTNQDGRYKTIDPVGENNTFVSANKQWNQNPSDLVRMLKTWQEYCNVPIRSFILERLVLEFLGQWKYSGNDAFWYDWIVRDYFAYMLTRKDGFIIMPGTSEIVPIGNEWLSKTNTSATAAHTACEYEKLNSDAVATLEWQKLFGYEITRVT